MVEFAPLPRFDTGRALRFRNQAQFHPLKYLRALLIDFQERGGKAFADTAVSEIEEGDFIATNDPSIQGQHLNNVVVFTPVFIDGKIYSATGNGGSSGGGTSQLWAASVNNL